MILLIPYPPWATNWYYSGPEIAESGDPVNPVLVLSKTYVFGMLFSKECTHAASSSENQFQTSLARDVCICWTCSYEI